MFKILKKIYLENLNANNNAFDIKVQFEDKTINLTLDERKTAKAIQKITGSNDAKINETSSLKKLGLVNLNAIIESMKKNDMIDIKPQLKNEFDDKIKNMNEFSQKFILKHNNKLKQDKTFIKLKNNLKKNICKKNYNDLIVFLRHYDNKNKKKFTEEVLINLFGEKKYIDNYIFNTIFKSFLPLIGKHYITCYIDDDDNVVFNSSLKDSLEKSQKNTNNFNQYIEQKIIFSSNDAKKCVLSKQNICSKITNTKVIIAEKIGSYTTTELDLYVVLIFVLIILFFVFFLCASESVPPIIFIFVALMVLCAYGIISLI